MFYTSTHIISPTPLNKYNFDHTCLSKCTNYMERNVYGKKEPFSPSVRLSRCQMIISDQTRSLPFNVFNVQWTYFRFWVKRSWLGQSFNFTFDRDSHEFSNLWKIAVLKILCSSFYFTENIFNYVKLPDLTFETGPGSKNV